MVKARMTTADVAAEIACLRKLIGMRVANVYDLNPKTYAIKLARSGGVTGSGESEKELLLLESGVRLHTTQFARDKSNTPSGITLKIRKHIRTRRLEDIRQLGVDRVIDFQFGLGEQAHHLILELYASGNILLTNADYNVLTLLRSHRDDEKGISMMAKHRYPIESCRPFLRTSAEQLAAVLTGTDSKADAEGTDEAVAGEGPDSGAVRQGDGKGAVSRNGLPKGSKEGKDGGPSLKDVLGQVLGYGPTLCEHCILDAGLEPGARIQQPEGRLSEAQVRELLAAVGRFEDWLQLRRENPSEGFIVYQRPKAPGQVAVPKEKKAKKGKKGGAVNAPSEETPLSTAQKEALASDTNQPSGASAEGEATDGVKPEGPVKLFDEFTPLLLKQHEGREWVRFETFDAAMDEFFSKVEGQKLEQQQKQQEVAALSRLDKIKADQSNRVEALQATVQQSVRKAELIEYNLEEVDAAILAVRSALANGMDWADLGQMVKEERKAGNPVAGLIHSMQLEKNQITLLLSNNLDDMNEEEKTRPADKVEVDISLSAFANARMHFDTKKKHAIKQQKTVDATERALKAAEKKTAEQLAQVRSMAKLTSLRKVHWFEKFNWFVSSENYLVLAGRDAQQNEQLVKKHLDKGDVYVHADLHGAATCVVKNSNPEAPIPPLTLNQAGTMTVCRSSAWDAKIVTSAWWVHSHQVSKTAPTGEYLTVGSFMVRGKKNFLPPCPLVMGFGFLFRLEESCLAAHIGERRIRGEGEVDDTAEQEAVPRGRRVLNDGEAPKQEANREMDDEGADDTGEVEEDLGSGNEEPLKDGSSQSEDAERGEGGKVERGEREVTGQVTKGVTGNLPGEGGEVSGSGGEKSSALDDLLDKALGMGQSDQRGEGKASVEEEERAKAPKSGKRYLSKAERRKMKKGQVGDAEVDSTVLEREEKAEGSGGRESGEQAAGVVVDSMALNDDGSAGPSIERGTGRANGKALRQEERNVEAMDMGRVEKDSMKAEGTSKPVGLQQKSGKAEEDSKRRGHTKGEPAAPRSEDQTRGKEETEGLTRGKRAKLKKVKDKYADQDEEDRELRMAILASAGNKEKAAQRGGKKAGKDARGKGEGKQESTGSVENELKVCYKCKQAGHVARDCPVGEGESATTSAAESAVTEEKVVESVGGEKFGDEKESGTGRPNADGETRESDAFRLSRRARARAQNEGERAEIAAILEEENLQELPDEDRDRLTELDALTGVPKAEDVLLYGVPMCGPYTALQGFKYKVKLTPGTLKKGKAAKTAVEVFSRMPEATRQEKELMKAVQDPDLVAVMLGNVKVTAPGLTKMKQTQKKGKKAAAQK